MMPAIVEIEWVDSASRHGWADDDDLEKTGLMRFATVGFVLAESDEWIKVSEAFNLDSGEDISSKYGCIHTIPKINITKRTELVAERPPS